MATHTHEDRPPVLLKVNNLKRSFGGRSALEIPSLEVRAGELLALIGYSGSGKTTCLETLGLMSRPTAEELREAEVVYQLQYNGAATPFSIQDLWEDEPLRTWARAAHLSFMFQRANLLPALSALDNARLGLLLQGNTEEETRDRAKRQLTTLSLNPDHEDIRTLSGGMLQRVAFGRATLPHFQLLFADEPTGNLDPENAQKVWEKLQQTLKVEQDPPGVLVVTHDLEMACRFATRVVVIGQDGYLNPTHSLDLAGKDRTDPAHRETLRRWMAQTRAVEEVPTQVNTRPSPPLMNTLEARPRLSGQMLRDLRTGQDRLQHLLARRPLVTPRPLQKVAFLMMLWVTLLALGLAQGTREYLKVRMSDPYVSWLTLDLPFGEREKTEAAEAWIRQNHERYGIRDVRRHHPVTLQLWDQSTGDGTRPEARLASGITLGHDEPLLQRVCEMQILGSPCQTLQDKDGASTPLGTLASVTAVLTPFDSAEDRGLLVTEELLRTFGYPPDAPFLLLSSDGGSSPRQIPLPIRAVVSALPEGETLAMTPFLRKQIYFNSHGPLDPEGGADLVYYLAPPLSASARGLLADTLKKSLSTAPAQGPGATVELVEDTLSHRPGTRLQLTFEGSSTLQDRDALSDWLIQQGHLPPGALRLYSWTPAPAALTRKDDAGLISLYLAQESLDRAPALRTDLQQALGAELDVARVEALKNYDSVAFSSALLSLAVMLLGGLCAGAFITYSLYSMLLQMREFLGTLLAFGVGRKTLEVIFRRQLLEKLVWAFGLALPPVWAVGKLCFSGRGAQVLGLPTAADESLFHFWNGWMLGFVLLMFVLGVSCVRLTAQRLLRQDPGALIYDRLQ